jgi:leukotriene-A4 hydrolase
VLDTSGLRIQQCELVEMRENDWRRDRTGPLPADPRPDGSPTRALSFSVGNDEDPRKSPACFGTPLRIQLPDDRQQHQNGGQAEHAVCCVRIRYQTSADASGLQWLSPALTADRKLPYLFSQFQAIHARSALPCQDCPGVKFTYQACVHLEPPFQALMSARRHPRLSSASPSTSPSLFQFWQPVPISSYLLALVVADLDSRPLGPRSQLWTERSMLDACVREFQASTERYLRVAERLLGPYDWEFYDLLVLPFSFPYGGMENPNVTFLTPSLLAGDGSLTDVVAHEISHSWTGNLVTNSSWPHFWLNVGFTMFVERKILARLHSASEEATDAVGEQHRHFHALIGANALRDSVERYGAAHPFTALVPDLTAQDPDDSFSSVPYEKGFQVGVVLSVCRSD